MDQNYYNYVGNSAHGGVDNTGYRHSDDLGNIAPDYDQDENLGVDQFDGHADRETSRRIRSQSGEYDNSILESPAQHYSVKDHADGNGYVGNRNYDPKYGLRSRMQSRMPSSHDQSYGDGDNDSLETIDLSGLEDKSMWNVLHTVRLRRKSRKSRQSSRKRQSANGPLLHDVDDNAEDGILPSLQLRQKPKTLHERMLEAKEQSGHHVADVLR